MNPKLAKIIAYESTNFQWQKLAHNWLLILALTIISVLKGSGTDSLIGVKKCDKIDWTLFAILQVICLSFLAWGLIIVKKEYAEKVEAGYKFIPGDLEATPKNLVLINLISFGGAAAAAFCGIGPGFIFGPILLLIGIEAQVATATGMYVTMFTTLSATIQVIIYKKIFLHYSLYF
jgi:uncharacterized membrane protein YfcA